MRDNIKFNLRDGDYEVRISKTIDGRPQPELVKWKGDSCYVIVVWHSDSEGEWEAEFVRNRPFNEFEEGFPPYVWKMMKCLNEIINIKGNENEEE